MSIFKSILLNTQDLYNSLRILTSRGIKCLYFNIILLIAPFINDKPLWILSKNT